MRIKDRKKFFRFLILLLIFIFTISCGVKRFVFNDEPKKVEMVSDEIKVDVLSLNKDNTPLEPKKKDIVKLKANEESKSEVLETKKVEEVAKKELEEFRFVKNQSIFVFKDEA
ncbi:MAG: hypothetical protein ACRC4Y_00425, partial [Cetobacterium sp.]